MYSDGVVVRHNRIQGAQGATGMGIGFKESSGAEIEANAILYCATGLYLDISPFDPESRNRIERNQLAYNGIGVLFHSDWQGNEFRDNEFVGNFTQVAVRGGGGATRHVWERNHWDDYQGFDRDGDDLGDTPYELYAYADRLWMDVPAAQFFKGSPMLEVIDFLERLAPFSPPDLLVRDDKPLRLADTRVAGLPGIKPEPPAAETEDEEESGKAEPASKASADGFDAYEALRRSLGRE
jgi:nitrous oxidase accessory protein